MKRFEELSEGDYECDYYKGKIDSARYYISQVMPTVFMLTDMIRAADAVSFDCLEEVFIVN